MSKTLNANQTQKVDRRFLQPIYFVHILNVGGAAETLHFSDRTFTYNGHNYEDYLMDLPSLAQSIERFGGFLNINAQLTFKNHKFRASNTLLEWFDANPITRKEMELYVLYIDTGETFGSDVSTKLCRLGIGEFRQITRQNFQTELCTITHLLDQKNILYRINTTDWPNADPKIVGQVANIVYGSVKDIPCHCVKTGAYSTLRADMTNPEQVVVPLTETDYPIAFAATGSVMIEDEEIQYTCLGVDPANPKLTGCIRGKNGTAKVIHKEGTPVLRVLSNYKWMVAGHSMKSVDAVKLDRVLIPSGDYTVNVNDSGRTTIQFSQRKILKHQGAHGHPMTATKEHHPKSGLFSPSVCDGKWNRQFTISNLYDKNEETCMSVRIRSYDPPSNLFVKFKVNFPTYSGQKPKKVFACIEHQTEYSNFGGEYVKMTSPIAVYLDKTNTKKTERIKLDGTTVPSSLVIRAQYAGGYPNQVLVATKIYEVWLEIELDETGSSAAAGVFGAMDDVFSPLVTADGQGYKDTAGGTYTGVANALIENPSDVRRHFLIAVLGRIAGDLYTTDFDDMRTFYAARVAGGYLIASLLNQISEIPSEILARLDFETRSTLREDGGLYHLAFNEAAAPTSILTITQDDIYGEPVFGQTAIDEVRNKLRCMYDMDWAGSLASNRYLSNFMQSLEVNDPTSITKYGELAEDIEFQACKKTLMVDDVADWILTQKKDVLKTVSLTVSHVARILEKGDYFILTWIFWSGLKWRVLNIEETPGQQTFQIEAVQYPI
jgi:hypothetical protein